MAIVAQLVERITGAGDNDLRDGIHAIILAIDDAVDTTDAEIQTRGVTVCNANGLDLSVGYFNSNTAIAATYDAADDVTVWKSDKLLQVIA